MEIKNAQTQTLIDEDNIRSWYKIFIQSKAYQDYLNNENEFNLEADRAIIKYLLDVVLLEDEKFLTIIEELYLTGQKMPNM